MKKPPEGGFGVFWRPRVKSTQGLRRITLTYPNLIRLFYLINKVP